MTYKKRLLASLLCVTSFNSLAQDTVEPDDEDTSYMVGLMGVSDNSIYVGGEDKTQLLPYLNIQWGDFFLEGPSLGYRLFEHDNMTMAISLDFAGLGQNDWDDSPLLQDMRTIDNAIMASVRNRYETEVGEIGNGIEV